MFWVWFILAASIIGLVAYWLIVTTEGVYVGQWLVTLLYDRVADAYDDIKEYGITDEYYFLSVPLAQALGSDFEGVIVDVASGTGRVSAAMKQLPDFQGRVIGLDHSIQMLLAGRKKMSDLVLVQADALYLPFASETISAVTCLEALEFLPSPAKGIAELARVLVPGGVLLTTNRTGLEAKLMPGKALSDIALRRILQNIPLNKIAFRIWETVDSFTIKAEKDDALEAYIQAQREGSFWKRLRLELTTSRYQKVWARKPMKEHCRKRSG